MNNYPVTAVMPALLLLLLPLQGAAQEQPVFEPEPGEVSALNQQHQQTQLQIQQQKLDNELMRLRLAYAGMAAERRQLVLKSVAAVSVSGANQNEAAASYVVSDVNFSHMQVQWLEGEEPRWRIHYSNEESRHD